MTPDEAKKFILDNISFTTQMVAQAREFILKNFDKNTRTLIENFLLSIDAPLENNKVSLRYDKPELGLKKVAEHISWRHAACLAIMDMIRSNELFQNHKHLDDGIPRIHWEKKDPSGSEMGSSWDFDEISIKIPLYVKLPFPSSHGAQAVKKDEPSVSAGGSMDKRNIFVVHGRNENARKALFDFLLAIRLNPMEWSHLINKTKKGSPHIREILDAAFSEAQAVVVLLTGDDEARLIDKFCNGKEQDYEKNLTPQARPNVLFEAGMAFGHHPDKTILVELGDVRPFSDIAGLHVIKMDGSIPKRKELAQRLQNAGCSVDTVGDDWLNAGNFEGAILPYEAKDSHKEASSNNDYDDNITSEQLHDEYTTILEFLAKFEDPVYESSIAENLSIPHQKAKYLLEKLKKKGYVLDYTSYMDGIKYSLDEGGRDFLFGKGSL